jgi:pimeloyl-ACP methyl ester carboxylesterase
MPYLQFQTKRIFYRIEGEGKPVFLLHGFAEDGNIWNQQIEALKENNLLVVPDLPGSGNSEMLDWECNLKDYADVVNAIANEVVFKNDLSKQICLIGHSMGGYITLAFAEKYPELLNSLGLFHSSAFADTEEKKLTRKKAIDFIKKNGTELFLKTSIPNLFTEETKKQHPQLIKQLFELAKNIPAEVLIQYYEAMILRPDRTSVLRNFEKPVLFIIGKYDNSVPLQSSLEQCYLPPVSVVHILENSAHMGMFEEPELSNFFLKDFLTNFLKAQ